MEPVAVFLTILAALILIGVAGYLVVRHRKAEAQTDYSDAGLEIVYEDEPAEETVLPEVPDEERPETVEVANPSTIGTAEVVATPAATRVFNGATAYKPAAPAEAVTSPASTEAVFGTPVVADTETSETATVSGTSTDGEATRTN